MSNYSLRIINFCMTLIVVFIIFFKCFILLDAEIKHKSGKKHHGPAEIKGKWQAYLVPNKSMTPCKEKKKKETGKMFPDTSNNKWKNFPQAQ